MSKADLQQKKMARVRASRRREPLVVLAILGLALWAWSGGLWDIWSESDAAWIQAVRESGHRLGDSHGHWLIPNFILNTLLTLNHGAVSTWLLRMPSVIFGVLAVLLCYRIATLLFGAGVGWLSALMFMALGGLVGAVPSLEPGMMLAAWVMFALDCWLQGRSGRRLWRPLGASVVFSVLAMFTVGWPGLAMAVVIVAVDAVLRRGWAILVAWTAAGVLGAIISARQWEPVLTATLPAAAIATGLFLHWLWAKGLSASLGRKLGLAAMISVVLIFAFGLFMYHEPDFFWSRGFFVLPSGLFALCVFLGLLLILSFVMMIWPRMPVLIVGFIVALMAANLVVLGGLRPAMNPYRSSANIADLLDDYLPAKDAHVGAIGEANDPRLHVHGHYKIQNLSTNPRKFATEQRMPALVIGRRGDVDKLMPMLRVTGYSAVKTIASMRRSFVVLRRGQDTRKETDPVMRFLTLGDMGTGNIHQYNVGLRMAEQTDWNGPIAACLMLGDNLYGDDALGKQMRERFLKPFAPLIKRKIPFYAALGNHDYSPPAKMKYEIKTPWFNMKGRNYYSQTFGQRLMTVFFIDCERIKDDPAQYLWLANELRNCRSRWKVLVNHIPMVASNVLHADSPATFDLLDELMRNGGVDLVLSGHNHIYERRKLLEGIQYLTVGSGGHVSDDFEFPPDKNRAAGYNRTCVFAWMEVSEEAMRFRAINEYGKLIDEFSLSHDAAGKLEVKEYPRPQRPWRDELPTMTRAHVLAAEAVWGKCAAGFSRARVYAKR